MPPDRDEALRWAAYAEEDWEYGVAGIERFPRGAGWNLHQAAEKYLKAVLLGEGWDPPRTHDLLHLLDAIHPDRGDELERALSALAPFGVASRYPGDLPRVTPDEAARARDAAAVVRRFAGARPGAAGVWRDRRKSPQHSSRRPTSRRRDGDSAPTSLARRRRRRRRSTHGGTRPSEPTGRA
ncbi:MAG: HEPN domain-containing protein [Acidobacteria bacterium]|nr:HEPN domain-containing protein [Acidobacteriota bacterium]